MTRKYDSTVARMAGNIAPALLRIYGAGPDTQPHVVQTAVQIARAIVAEVERTEARQEGSEP